MFSSSFITILFVVLALITFWRFTLVLFVALIITALISFLMQVGSTTAASGVATGWSRVDMLAAAGPGWVMDPPDGAVADGL